MIRVRPLVILFVAALSALTSFAQKTDRNEATTLFTLRNGETIEGRLVGETKQNLTIETWLGRRELPLVTVVARRSAAELRESYRVELQKTEEKDLAEHLRLARWCLARGFSSGLAAELDAILRIDPDHDYALSLVDRLAPVYRLAAKNDQDPEKPRWARREVDLLYAAGREQSIFGAVMLARQLASFPIDIQMNAAIDHVERGSEAQRVMAVSALGRSDETRRVKPLYRRSLGDPSAVVRQRANRSLIAHDDGTTAGPFVKALLESELAAVRVRAAEALAMLGDQRAVPPLISALAAAGSGGAPRNHVRFSRQQAYVKDFDVEIAQAAVIADPIIDRVEDGVVLDVAVVSVGIERRIYSASLRGLTGRDLGGDARDWAAWWREEGSKGGSR